MDIAAARRSLLSAWIFVLLSTTCSAVAQAKHLPSAPPTDRTAEILDNYRGGRPTSGEIKAADIRAALEVLEKGNPPARLPPDSADAHSLDFVDATISGPLDLRRLGCTEISCRATRPCLPDDPFDTNLYSAKSEVHTKLHFLRVSFRKSDCATSFNADHVTFTGTLLLQDVEMDGAVLLSHTKFKGSLNWLFSTFHSRIDAEFSAFEGADIGFYNCLFDGDVIFDRATILQKLRLRNNFFGARASFRYAILWSDLDLSGSDFKDAVVFSSLNPSWSCDKPDCSAEEKRQLRTQELVVKERKGNVISRIPAGALLLRSVRFEGFPTFDGSRLAYLDARREVGNIQETHESADTKVVLYRIPRLTVFDQGLDLRDLYCGRCSLAEAQIAGNVDFENAVFGHLLDVENMQISGSANFRKVTFPSFHEHPKKAYARPLQEYRSGDDLEKSRDGLANWDGMYASGLVANVKTLLKWEQVAGAIDLDDDDSLSKFEEIMKSNEDLSGQNEAAYYRQAAITAKERTLWPSIQKFGWGYGHRPLWLSGWCGALILLFSAAYWSQTTGMKEAGKPLASQLRRLRFALLFSFKTSLYPTWGYDNSLTARFKAITSIQSLLFKVLLALLLFSMANVSPLLKSLAGLFIH